jgi:hypothetical protein
VALVLADLRPPEMSGMELMVVHVQPFALALVVPGFRWTAAAALYGLVGEAAPRGGT